MSDIEQLQWSARIVDTSGRPSPSFLRQWKTLADVINDAFILPTPFTYDGESALKSIGLNATPSPWTGITSLEMGAAGNFIGGTAGDATVYIGTGAYYNAGWKYAFTSKAVSKYELEQGQHLWSVAAAGTAGNAVTWVNALRLDVSGNLLVGKTASALATAGFQSAPSGQTDVTVSGSECMNLVRLGSNGTMMRFFHTDAATVIGSISTSGGTTTSYNTSSDEAFKENIKPASDVGHLIDAAAVSEFDWKEDGAKQVAGFVAQDLLDTLAPSVPGLVNERDDGLLEYDPSKLVPLLWKEVQSLRARLASAGIK